MKAKVVFYKRYSKQTFILINLRYNYIIASDPTSIPTYRQQRRTLEVLSLIYSRYQVSRLIVNDITTQARLARPRILITTFDVNNEIAKITYRILGLRTVYQQFLYKLQATYYVINYQDSQLFRIFQTFNQNIDLQKNDNSKVLIVDTTYLVNYCYILLV